MADRDAFRALKEASQQHQFLEVIDRDEAKRRFHEHLCLEPLGTECVALDAALQRCLAEAVRAGVDVTAFDRANVDGFAVQARDTHGAQEETPAVLTLNDEVLAPGQVPQQTVSPNTATPIATGAMLPRGADAVVMIEHTELIEDTDALRLQVRRAASTGQHITYAGTDIGLGETVLWAGQLLSSREIGVLAALGLAEVRVYRRPRVAILSTGDEIIAPGTPPRPGTVYDSNAPILASAVRELGGEPECLGIVGDDAPALQAALERALTCDLILLSGGTSKGAGDLSYRVLQSLPGPGIVAHGVALKPGKPICLAVSDGRPIVILPGFPTSAVFTFHEFVAPVIRALGGRPAESPADIRARIPMRVNSERGRTEFLLVNLVHSEHGLAAYPMGKGSGSVTTFSRADGFITIDQQTEILEAGTSVDVTLLGQSLEPADLVIIGSHCLGLDLLVGEIVARGFRVKVMAVGSTAGLAAARRGECDLAGIHLLDEASGEYNRPFVTAGMRLLSGYTRMQGVVCRPDSPLADSTSAEELVQRALADEQRYVMVNRNAGSGTRILIDGLLGERRPSGYAIQPRSHNAVAAAVVQGRADWGVAIQTVATQYGLTFLPLRSEHYDFLVPEARWDRPPVAAFRALLSDPDVRARLQKSGFEFAAP